MDVDHRFRTLTCNACGYYGLHIVDAQTTECCQCGADNPKE